jgi:hypothetical protein
MGTAAPSQSLATVNPGRRATVSGQRGEVQDVYISRLTSSFRPLTVVR